MAGREVGDQEDYALTYQERIGLALVESMQKRRRRVESERRMKREMRKNAQKERGDEAQRMAHG